MMMAEVRKSVSSPDQDSRAERQTDRVLQKKEGDESDGDEEEFSFMCGGENASAEDAFINGQLRPVFPLFNRELFFTADELDSLYGNLPAKPPVKKVFVETKNSGREATPSAAGGTAVDVSPGICKKSNSTGFSKLWRFKDLLGRSNSDGRDAFVFLNSFHAPPSAAHSQIGKEENEKKVPVVKINGKGKKSLSAHEAYMRSKAKDEDKRRSYLPYRPELMGFFTNINGGLSKNTHPY